MFNDKLLENDYTRFELRYDLNQIFGLSSWCKLIIITYKDFENISATNILSNIGLLDKLNQFEKEKNNDLNVLYINFESQSPYQKDFIYFCNQFLKNIEYINLIVIDNIGNINYSEAWHKKVVKGNPLINFPKTKNIIYK